MNNFSGIGRIAVDPKLGNGVVNSLLAVKRVYKSSDGDTDFVPLTIFGKQADNFNRLTKKGERIGIDGRIKTSTYTNEQGQTEHNWSVVVDHFYLLDNKLNSKLDSKLDSKLNSKLNSKPKSSQEVASLTAEQIATLSSQLADASQQARESLTAQKVF